jgi:hypothetical protein
VAPDDPDLDPHRTDAQKEWADWAAHGYRKLYQPRSMLWFGGLFCIAFTVFLGIVLWLSTSGRWP